MKKKFSYKIGTYFIYQDSQTGEIDSCILTSVYSGVGKASNPVDQYAADYIVMTFNVYKSGNQAHDYLTILEDNYMFFKLWDSTSYDERLIIYPLSTIGVYKSAQGLQISVLDIIPKYFLNGNYYDTVFKVKYSEHNHDDTFYFSNNPGIIKMPVNEYSLNSNWELLKYSILR